MLRSSHFRCENVCVCCVWSQTYISSSDDTPWAPDRHLGVNLLNEISAALTRALNLPPFTRRTGTTFDSRGGVWEQPLSPGQWTNIGWAVEEEHGWPLGSVWLDIWSPLFLKEFCISVSLKVLAFSFYFEIVLFVCWIVVLHQGNFVTWASRQV